MTSMSMYHCRVSCLRHTAPPSFSLSVSALCYSLQWTPGKSAFYRRINYYNSQLQITQQQPFTFVGIDSLLKQFWHSNKPCCGIKYSFEYSLFAVLIQGKTNKRVRGCTMY